MPAPIYTSNPPLRTRKLLEDFPAPTSQFLGAVAEDTFIHNPTRAIFDWMRLDALEDNAQGVGGRLVPQDEALARIKEEGITLEVPEDGIRENALSYLVERKRAEVRRQSVMMRADPGLAASAAAIGVGLGGSLLDPLNLAVSFTPIGAARYAGAMKNAATPLARAGVRARYGAVQGLAGATAVEPLVLGSAVAHQDDYGMYDSLANLAFGTVLGGGLHAGAGAAADAIAKGLPWQRAKANGKTAGIIHDMPAEQREALLRTAVAQVMDGRHVNIEGLGRSFGRPDLMSTTAVGRTADDMNIRLQVDDAGPVARGEPAGAYQQRVMAAARQAQPVLFDQLDKVEAEFRKATDRATTLQAKASAATPDDIHAAERLRRIDAELREKLDPRRRKKLENKRAEIIKEHGDKLDQKLKDFTGRKTKEIKELEALRTRMAELETERVRLKQDTDKLVDRTIRKTPSEKRMEQQYRVRQIEGDARAANALDGMRGYNAAAAAEVKEVLKNAVETTDRASIEAELSEIEADVKDLAKRLEVEIDDDLDGTRTLVEEAKTYSKAARALALCNMRRAG